MNLSTIEFDFLENQDITEIVSGEYTDEFWERLFDLSSMRDSVSGFIIHKSYIKQHLDDIKSDGEESEEFRIENEPWRIFLQSIYDSMKTNSIYIK